MPRIARVVVPGWAHHVVQRGVRSMRVFQSDEDRRLYLRLLHEESQKAGLDFIAWCLMDNHVHFLCVPTREDSLARAFKEGHRRYTRMVNLREGCTGHLWQERFHSYVVGDDAYLHAAIRYILLNPVVAGMAPRPEEWPWSSARFHLGLRNWDDLAKDNKPLGLDLDWPKLFLYWSEEEAELIQASLSSGRPRVSPPRLKELEALTQRNLTPKRQRGQFT